MSEVYCDVYIVQIPGDYGTEEEPADLAINIARKDQGVYAVPCEWHVETVGEDDVVVVRYRAAFPRAEISGRAPYFAEGRGGVNMDFHKGQDSSVGEIRLLRLDGIRYLVRAACV